MIVSISAAVVSAAVVSAAVVSAAVVSAVVVSGATPKKAFEQQAQSSKSVSELEQLDAVENLLLEELGTPTLQKAVRQPGAGVGGQQRGAGVSGPSLTSTIAARMVAERLRTTWCYQSITFSDDPLISGMSVEELRWAEIEQDQRTIIKDESAVENATDDGETITKAAEDESALPGKVEEPAADNKLAAALSQLAVSEANAAALAAAMRGQQRRLNTVNEQLAAAKSQIMVSAESSPVGARQDKETAAANKAAEDEAAANKAAEDEAASNKAAEEDAASNKAADAVAAKKSEDEAAAIMKAVEDEAASLRKAAEEESAKRYVRSVV